MGEALLQGKPFENRLSRLPVSFQKAGEKEKENRNANPMNNLHLLDFKNPLRRKY
jgi:hypothetical protein